MIKRVFRIIAKTILGIIAFVFLYLGTAWLLSRIGVSKEKDTKPEITIYIKTNGVHTDIVMPVHTPQWNWATRIPYTNTSDKDTLGKYVGIGWGDRGFYLETPPWADLKFSTAFKAAFALSRTAMHATFYNTLAEDKNCIRIDISKEQYSRLVTYVESTFKHDSLGNTILIPTNAVYSGADAFYEAKGRYNLFKTCNSWTNKGLKVAGQKAAIWAPFDWGIFYQYR